MVASSVDAHYKQSLILKSRGHLQRLLRLAADGFSGALRLKHILAASTLFGQHANGSHLKVIQKLRRRLNARHQQMVSCPRAGDVEQVALGVINFLQIGVVANRLDAIL